MVSYTRSQVGHTLVEVMFAVIVLGVMAGTVGVGDAGQAQTITRSFAETVALASADGRLAELRTAEPPVVGERSFDIGAAARRQLPEARGREMIREPEPGLFSVEVLVEWRPAGATRPVRVELATLIAREVPR